MTAPRLRSSTQVWLFVAAWLWLVVFGAWRSLQLEKAGFELPFWLDPTAAWLAAIVMAALGTVLLATGHQRAAAVILLVTSALGLVPPLSFTQVAPAFWMMLFAATMFHGDNAKLWAARHRDFLAVVAWLMLLPGGWLAFVASGLPATAADAPGHPFVLWLGGSIVAAIGTGLTLRGHSHTARSLLAALIVISFMPVLLLLTYQPGYWMLLAAALPDDSASGARTQGQPESVDASGATR